AGRQQTDCQKKPKPNGGDLRKASLVHGGSRRGGSGSEETRHSLIVENGRRGRRFRGLVTVRDRTLRPCLRLRRCSLRTGLPCKGQAVTMQRWQILSYWKAPIPRP